MVTVSENTYYDVNIKLTNQTNCDQLCDKIKKIIQRYVKDQNPEDLILNISIKRVAHTVDQNIQKIDISR